MTLVKGPKDVRDQIRKKFWLGPVICQGGTGGSMLVLTPEDQNSNPGPGENFFLKLTISRFHFYKNFRDNYPQLCRCCNIFSNIRFHYYIYFIFYVFNEHLLPI